MMKVRVSTNRGRVPLKASTSHERACYRKQTSEVACNSCIITFECSIRANWCRATRSSRCIARHTAPHLHGYHFPVLRLEALPDSEPYPHLGCQSPTLAAQTPHCHKILLFMPASNRVCA